jgi:hypothetical protein
MLILDVGSRHVYENKINMDILTANKSDNFGNMTGVLQRNWGLGGKKAVKSSELRA